MNVLHRPVEITTSSGRSSLVYDEAKFSVLSSQFR